MKKFLISGLVIVIFVISGCTAKPIESEVSSIEDSEEITTTEEIIEEKTEETTEEVTEETLEPERYFTYKVKYQERHGQGIIITDESFPGTLRVTLADDLPESFFEQIDCKSSQECFKQVIQGILDSLEGKKVILRDTQRGAPQFCYIDTTKPVEIVFKFIQTKEEESGPLYVPYFDEEHGGIPCISFAFVETIDGGLRFISYQSPRFLEDALNIPRGRYLISAGLGWMVSILKFHPEVLGWDYIHPTKIIASEEEKGFDRKISQRPEELENPNLPSPSILILKGER